MIAKWVVNVTRMGEMKMEHRILMGKCSLTRLRRRRSENNIRKIGCEDGWWSSELCPMVGFGISGV
jgi:hypothetical protein